MINYATTSGKSVTRQQESRKQHTRVIGVIMNDYFRDAINGRKQNWKNRRSVVRVPAECYNNVNVLKNSFVVRHVEFIARHTVASLGRDALFFSKNIIKNYCTITITYKIVLHITQKKKYIYILYIFPNSTF